MIKLLTPTALYWHYVLDVFLTHIFVIAFLQAGQPFAASLFIATDSIFKITLAIFTSRITSKLPPWIRGRISLISRIILAILWLYAINQLTHTVIISPSVIIPFLVFKLIMMADTSISAEFVFSLRDNFKIDLSQITAIQLIYIRGSTAIAPAIALVLLATPLTKIIIFILSLMIIMFGAYYFRKIYFSPTKHHAKHIHQPLSFKTLTTHPLMRWGLLYQLLENIAYAGVSLLLLSSLQKTSHHFINNITFLYASFFIVQMLVLIFGKNIVAISSTFGIGCLSAITAIFVIITSLAQQHSYIALFACLGIGATYSFSLSAIQVVLTEKLQGPSYTEYAGWSQTAGRSASFFITAVLGLAMNAGYSYSTLLLLCGLMGIASAAILTYLPAENHLDEKILEPR